jgi:hypothetical protein
MGYNEIKNDKRILIQNHKCVLLILRKTNNQEINKICLVIVKISWELKKKLNYSIFKDNYDIM